MGYILLRLVRCSLVLFGLIGLVSFPLLGHVWLDLVVWLVLVKVLLVFGRFS